MRRLALSIGSRLPRSTAREYLDDAEVPPAELHANLDDLRRLNRYLGGRRVLLAALRRLWRDAGRPRQWRILDLGTGGGDLLAAMRRWARQRDLQGCLVGLDPHAGVLGYAHAGLRADPEVTLVQANALQAPFRPSSFDVVVCCTTLHHLDWDEGVELLRQMASLARHGLVVSDLRRAWLHYVGARFLLTLLSRNRLTRHDGPLSVRRAYTPAEVHQMAQAAGLRGARVRRVWPYRLALIHAVPAAADDGQKPPDRSQ